MFPAHGPQKDPGEVWFVISRETAHSVLLCRLSRAACTTRALVFASHGGGGDLPRLCFARSRQTLLFSRARQQPGTMHSVPADPREVALVNSLFRKHLYPIWLQRSKCSLLLMTTVCSNVTKSEVWKICMEHEKPGWKQDLSYKRRVASSTGGISLVICWI